MRVSYEWLKDYIDLRISPEKLAETLTMAGLSVESIQHVGQEVVIEIEVTANRPDWLSVIGVAREISAITGAKLRMPAIKKSPVASYQSPVKVKIKEKSLCPRYTARIIRNVKVVESPAWLKARLEAIGLRPVNNIVDITNFCLFETGEPMHAFDLDKIESKEVIVRRARRGERILLIEGAEKILDETALVIADSTKPIAIAGIMGGLDTEVTGSTKNILLEAASFDPISVRRSSRKFGISTESSYRFERKVDISNIANASDRAARLISEIAGGQIGPLIDIGSKKSPKESITLRHARLNKILGIEIAAATVKKILNRLGLKIRSSSKNALLVETPAFRVDLHAEIDVIEEIARIYGYNKIPDTIPNEVEKSVRIDFDRIVNTKIRSVMTGLGADEIITYSLLSKRILEAAGLSDRPIVEIANPLTSEQEIMRPSLVVGMLNSILWNMNRKTKDLRLFEVSKVYIRQAANKFAEHTHLCIGMAGQSFESWSGACRSSNFYELKGLVETLLFQLGIGSALFKYTKDERFSPGACAAIEIGSRTIGILGEVDREVLNNFDIRDKVYISEIDIDAILEWVRLEKNFKDLPKYPSVHRDISIVVGRSVLNTDIVSSVKNAAGNILKDVRLIDRYKGQQIPPDKIGLTYRLEYQDLNKTLEEKEVSEVHARVLRELEREVGAKLR